MTAAAPVSLFAWLGSYSRLLADDWNHILFGKLLGPWQSMVYWREAHNGSYAHYFLHGLVAPLDTLVPALAAHVILALWMAGMYALALRGLAWLGVSRDRRKLALATAGLTVAAAINALYHPQAFFWYSGSTRYTLPLTAFVLYLALVVYAAPRLRRPRGLLAIALVGAAVCFAFAGLSEMYLIFQIVLLSLLLVFAFFFVEASARRPYLWLLGAGWLATALSLLVQITATGITKRVSVINEIRAPIRSLPELALETARKVFEYIGQQEVFAGFMLLFALSIFIVLRFARAESATVKAAPIKLQVSLLGLCLALQVVFIPILLSHSSDQTQIFDRYSLAYTTVILLNLCQCALFLVLIWKRAQIESRLRATDSGWGIYCGAMLCLITLLFAATQIRSIHYIPSAYLFVSGFVCIVALCWQLQGPGRDGAILLWWRGAGFWLLATPLLMAVLVAVSLYVQGFVSVRVMSGSAFLQVSGGLLWGVPLALSLRRTALVSAGGTAWLKRVEWASLALALILAAGITIGQAHAIPGLRAFAAEWDERHATMIRLGPSGMDSHKTPQLEHDITEHFCCSNETSAMLADYYYGFAPLPKPLPASPG